MGNDITAEENKIYNIMALDVVILLDEVVTRKKNLKGKNSLIVCRWIFDSRMIIPTSNGEKLFERRAARGSN